MIDQTVSSRSSGVTPDIRILDHGPVRAAVEASFSLEGSDFAQRIVLNAGSRRIDFRTRVNWQPNPSNGGSDCAAGTDAYNTFAGFADMTGVIYYGSTGWWVDLTFTGLDPATEYTFATSAARNSYTGRLTRYSISGADTYGNASTSGVDEISEDSVRFNTGDNHNEGYVARWTGIRAADGTFKVRAEADPENPSDYKAYSFDVFRLKGGFGGTDRRDQMRPTTWHN